MSKENIIPAWMIRKSQPKPEAGGRSAHKIVVVDGKLTLALSKEKPKSEKKKLISFSNHDLG